MIWNLTLWCFFSLTYIFKVNTHTPTFVNMVMPFSQIPLKQRKMGHVIWPKQDPSKYISCGRWDHSSSTNDAPVRIPQSYYDADLTSKVLCLDYNDSFSMFLAVPHIDIFVEAKTIKDLRWPSLDSTLKSGDSCQKKVGCHNYLIYIKIKVIPTDS